MKLYRVFLIALLAGTFAVVGCNDEPSSSGGGNGGGEVCDACDVPALKGACETTYNLCIQDDVGTPEDCAVAALLTCGEEV